MLAKKTWQIVAIRQIRQKFSPRQSFVLYGINYLRILEGLKVKVFVLWLFYSIEYFKLALLFHSYPITYSGIMDTYLVMLCYFTSKIFIHVNC